MTMWDDLGEFIVKKCQNNKIDSNSCKVVEIGIGKFSGVSDYLANHENIEFISTDINPDNEDIIFDDIANPNLDIYKNARIIYSIRPPKEIQKYIDNIAKKIGTILIIKPLFNEDIAINSNMKLVNYKKAVFYQRNNRN